MSRTFLEGILKPGFWALVCQRGRVINVRLPLRILMKTTYNKAGSVFNSSILYHCYASWEI